jgi:hypothetical protein
MTTKNHRLSAGLSQFVNGCRESRAGVLSLRRDLQRQLATKSAVVHVRQFERNQSQADPSLPRAAQHFVQRTVNVGFQIGRFKKALAQLIFGHIVVTNFDCERADAVTFFAHLRK